VCDSDVGLLWAEKAAVTGRHSLAQLSQSIQSDARLT